MDYYPFFERCSEAYSHRGIRGLSEVGRDCSLDERHFYDIVYRLVDKRNSSKPVRRIIGKLPQVFHDCAVKIIEKERLKSKNSEENKAFLPSYQ